MMMKYFIKCLAKIQIYNIHIIPFIKYLFMIAILFKILMLIFFMLITIYIFPYKI